MEWLIGAAALGLAALFVWGGARAAIRPPSTLPPEGPQEGPGGDELPPEGPGGLEPLPAPIDPLSAFLYMIRVAETGRRDESAYGIFYGGARFADWTDHPVETGIMSPVRLPDRFCRALNLSPGCVSTAAGAYQFILPTWRTLRQAGSWGPELPDFGIDSQDEAARRLLIQTGALRLLEAGDVRGAIARASRVWASLPGSTAQQGGKSLSEALALYDEGIAAQG